MVLPSPPAFFNPWNVHRIDPEVLLLSLCIFSYIRLTRHFLQGLPIELVVIN
jgi:hypothetical protein